jgi:histidyl-tRNA synthetase
MPTITAEVIEGCKKRPACAPRSTSEREDQLQGARALTAKVPVLLVVGKREAEEGSVSVRRMGVQQQEMMPLQRGKPCWP